jgi:hypothetical protein
MAQNDHQKADREIIVKMIKYIMGLSSACVINNEVVRCLSCDCELKNNSETELSKFFSEGYKALRIPESLLWLKIEVV